jgi:hypothetical protein
LEKEKMKRIEALKNELLRRQKEKQMTQREKEITEFERDKQQKDEAR